MVLGSGLLLGCVSPLREFRKGPTHPPLLRKQPDGGPGLHGASRDQMADISNRLLQGNSDLFASGLPPP